MLELPKMIQSVADCFAAGSGRAPVEAIAPAAAPVLRLYAWCCEPEGFTSNRVNGQGMGRPRRSNGCMKGGDQE